MTVSGAGNVYVADSGAGAALTAVVGTPSAGAPLTTGPLPGVLSTVAAVRGVAFFGTTLYLTNGNAIFAASNLP